MVAGVAITAVGGGVARGQVVYFSSADVSASAEVWSLEPKSFDGHTETWALGPGSGLLGAASASGAGTIDPAAMATASVELNGFLPAIGERVSGLGVSAMASASAQPQVEFVNPLASVASAGASTNYVIGLEFAGPTRVSYSAMLEDAFFQLLDAATGGQELFLSFASEFGEGEVVVEPGSVVVPAGQYIVKFGMSAYIAAEGTLGPFVFTESASLVGDVQFTAVPAPGVAAASLGGLVVARPRRRA